MTFLVFPTATPAELQIAPDRFADNALATVTLINDKGSDVEGKLGAPCVVPASNRETVSLVYRAADGAFLRFVVNVSPSDVDYQLVESMTMSVKPTVAATCYSSSHVSLNGEVSNRGLSRIRTGKGVHLGSVIDQVITLYGEPHETQVLNTEEVRFRYDLGYETGRYYQWTLTFHDGRLVEWTADAIPFFIEVGG